MMEEAAKTLVLKAQWLDEIISKYKTLRGNPGFYSQNWVELSELIEAAIEKVNSKSDRSLPPRD